MSDETNSYTIAAVTRAFEALEILTKGPVGVTELSKTMSVHKNYAFRVLASLLSAGFVEQNSETEKYSLTNRLSNLAGNATIQNSAEIATLATQIIKATGVQRSSNRVELVVEEEESTDSNSLTTGEGVTGSIGD